MYFQAAFVARPRQGARAAAPGVEGQGAVRVAAQGRREGARSPAASTRSLEIVDGHARRHDDRRVRRRSSTTGSPRRSIRRPSGPTPRWSTSRCSSCSPTCAPTASRPSSSRAAASSSCAPWAERVYGIPPEQVIGSSIKTKFEMRDGMPVLVRLPELELHRRQGRQARRHPAAHRPPPDRRVRQLRRRPADARSGPPPAPAPRFCLYRPPHRRRARVGLRPRVARRPARQGPRRGDGAKGWTVVDMKADWKTDLPVKACRGSSSRA